MMKTAYLVLGLLVVFAWQSSAHYGRKNKLRKTYKLESADLPERDTTKRNWEQFKRRLHPVRLSRPEYYEDNDLVAEDTPEMEETESHQKKDIEDMTSLLMEDEGSTFDELMLNDQKESTTF
ncbi:uncharacterized protein [Acropora muricata]|uniref:uncharacterized protein LOC114959875 n=1 Tax=Acropora millepora TaxID=45264 RepID=UPI001CF2E583|nr:uncharacterized protein LOC114959875 [Acropora millepora]